VFGPKPLLYLLAGLPGSGKSTDARTLEHAGVVRVSIDEWIIDRHGQIGVDYQVEDHIGLLGPALEWAHDCIVKELRRGVSVVFDHGLGSKEQRGEFKRLANDLGAGWRLCHFRVDVDDLVARLAERQHSNSTSSMHITPDMLRYLASVYEEPKEEGEQLIT
jgi:predicted kinase